MRGYNHYKRHKSKQIWGYLQNLLKVATEIEKVALKKLSGSWAFCKARVQEQGIMINLYKTGSAELEERCKCSEEGVEEIY